MRWRWLLLSVWIVLASGLGALGFYLQNRDTNQTEERFCRVTDELINIVSPSGARAARLHQIRMDFGC